MRLEAAAETGGEPVRRRVGRVPLIAHVIHRLVVGGLENGLVNLINRMPPDKYRHAIVCLKDYTGFSARIERPVELFAMHKQEGKDPALYFRLWRLFRRLRPEIVHTRNLAALEAQLPALLAGVPHRVHGEHGRDVHDLDGTSRKYRLLRAAFRPIVQRFVPLSRDLERYLTEDVHVASHKIVHICNGVDTERFCAATQERSVLPPGFAPSGSKVIGTVGRLEPVKDQVTLAEAFLRLVRQTPDGARRLRLVIVGEGSLRPQIEEILQRSALFDLVWLAGSRDDVPALLQAMDIFVLPSLAEGISNTVLEAMAAGLPVVATDVGGNRELVVEGETGYLVPRAHAMALAEAIGHYVDDPVRAKTHGEAGRERAVREFSIDEMVRRYTSVYDELAGSWGATPLGHSGSGNAR